MDSRFKPGSLVWFQPNVEKIDFTTGITSDPSSAVRAKVIAVHFTMDKVLYDLALQVEGGFYEIFPIRSVDSVFVCPIIEQRNKARLSSSEILEKIRERKHEEVKRELDIDFPKVTIPAYTPQKFDADPYVFPSGTIICDTSKFNFNHH